MGLAAIVPQAGGEVAEATPSQLFPALVERMARNQERRDGPREPNARARLSHCCRSAGVEVLTEPK
jgi:hypothetical protein